MQNPDEMLGRIWTNQNSHVFLVGMHKYTATGKQFGSFLNKDAFTS